MKNFIQPGDILDFTAPTGGVVSGTPLLIGGMVVVPQVTVVAGVRFAGLVRGSCLMPKTTGSAWVEGQPLYFDSATGSFTTAQSATARRAGAAAAAAQSADVTGQVWLANSAAPVNVA